MAVTQNAHLLRLVLSSRVFTAQVTSPTSNTIIAIASSTEKEFAGALYRAKFTAVPRPQMFWNSETASAIGNKIAHRITEIGLSTVRIDVQEELSRPLHYRRKLGPFFDSLKQAGINVAGAEDLPFMGLE